MTGLKIVSDDTTMGLIKETKNVNMAKGFLPIYLSNVYPDTSLLTTFPPFVGRYALYFQKKYLQPYSNLLISVSMATDE